MWTELERAVARAASSRDRAMAGRPSERRAAGVVHTPAELARYCARAVDRCLRGVLGHDHGVANPRVAVLDPACGPGAFLAALLAEGRGPGPHGLVGIERDPGALEVARSLVAPEAEACGWPLTLRRADTLASLDPWPESLPEGTTAVVVGNPPWRVGRGADPSPALGPLLEDFRRDGSGRDLGERRVGVLSDAYVRFWRWSAEVARRAPGGGVVLLVTNGSFLDGPVHRGMRACLQDWFDGVDVLDLGGSALVAREGAADGNVFGVRPQVAVTLAYRTGAGVGRGVRHARLWGSREDKLARLATLDPDDVPWRAVSGAAWVPRSGPDWPAGAVPLTALMPFHREGVQTNRDRIAIDADRERLVASAHAFVRGERRTGWEPAWVASGHYDPDRARERLGRLLARDPDGSLGRVVRRVAYRPGDDRWVLPVSPLCHRPRPALLRAVDASEAVLLTVRKDRGQRPWTHFGATRDVPDNCWLSTRSSCRTRAFPTHRPDGTPNLDPEAARPFAEVAGRPIAVGELLRFALATLAARGYRQRYGDALRGDYPRLLVPPGADGFEALVRAGDALLEAFVAGPIGSDKEVEVGHVRLRASAALVSGLEAADRAFARAFDLTPTPAHRPDAPRTTLR